MATEYQVKTFDDIVDAIREELKIQEGDTSSIARIKRNVNMVYLQEVCPLKRWKWLQESLDLSTQAVVTTGTVAVTAGSATVTLSSAPATSKTGYWFSVDGDEERYRIESHAAAGTSVVLETEYAGTTDSAATYKIWTDRLLLPADCRETIEVTQDNLTTPLEAVGLQAFRQYVNLNPKAEGRPEIYYVGEFVDPSPYATISGLPSLSTRASSGLVKTLVFDTTVASYLKVGDKIQISGAGGSYYNGEFTVSSVSTTTITYTGRQAYTESATADVSLTLKLITQEGDSEAARELYVWPAIDTNRTILHIDYIRNPQPLKEDADEPVIPIQDRNVLVYGGLDCSWARERNPEAADRNQGKYQNKLARMMGKNEDAADRVKLMPSSDYLRNKRSPRRRNNDSDF